MFDDFKILNKINEGNFSEVFLAENEKKKYAIKKTKKTYKDYIYTEINILKSINYDNIIKIITYFEHEEFIYTVLEYFNGKSLTLETKLNTTNFILKLKNILDYIHDRNIIHGDLCLDNILINDNEDIKLIDFGLSKDNKISGQMIFSSPELLKDIIRTKFSDIWAFGIICFILLTKESPYEGKTEKSLYLRIINKKINYSKFNLNGNQINFLKNILKKTPNKRKINVQYLL